MANRLGVAVHVKQRRSKGNKEIRQAIHRLRTNSARAAYNAARTIESSAKRRVHVRSGRLRKSIQREKIAFGKHRVIVGAFYGIYEEYGTRHEPPHPFFRPAVAEAKAKFSNDMRTVFK